MKFALGSDHRGFEMREALKEALTRKKIEVEDFGTFDKKPVDYPDYAWLVAEQVSVGKADFGILICGSGLGMSMAANKVSRIRAALCQSPNMARMARQHNNANILVLGADFTSKEDALGILDEWLKWPFERAIRHKRRIQKMQSLASCFVDPMEIYEKDPEVYSAIQAEAQRMQDQIVLVASESIANAAIREAQGSILTNKYAEGYPGKRLYPGCENADRVEQLAIDRAKRLFGAEHANVQPNGGTSANMAAYFSVLRPGDTMMAMKLAHGGHLSHGDAGSFSGRLFKIVSYGVSKQTEQIDYEQVAALAAKHRPKLIVAGCSTYTRIIDFKKFRDIANKVGASLMVDMAHLAGLVAAGCHPSPVPHGDFVTGTTHKTLAGPRGGFILCKERWADDIDRQVFPGVQGGPLVHVIAAKAICFYEALRPSFRRYQQQVVRNSQALAAALGEKGIRLVSGGTDNHQVLADVGSIGISGKAAAKLLEEAGILVNSVPIPFDQRDPSETSGIRLGTPVVTGRGMGVSEMKALGELIGDLLKRKDSSSLETARKRVAELTKSFPMK